MPSLQARMFLVFALIATLPLVALSYLALSETRGALAEEVGDSHENTAKAAAAFVGIYVENGQTLVAAEAGRGAYAGSADAIDAELARFRSQSTYDSEPVFAWVAFLDADAAVLATDPDGVLNLGADLSASPLYREPIRAGGPVVLDIAPLGDPTVPIATPVRSEARIVGVLVAQMSLEQLGAKLQTFAPGRNEGEGLVLTTDEGRLLVHPDAATVNATLDWSQVAPVREALRVGEGHIEFVDPVTETSDVAGFARVPKLGWVVIDAVPTSEAYAALTRLSAVLIVLSGFLVGAILLASVVLARRIVKPVRELTTASHALAAGRLAARIEVRGKDEIAELGRTFNEMAARISESLDGIRRSEARYRNLVESANDLILTVEPDGTLSFVGPLAERLLGFAPAELQGQEAATVMAAEERAAFQDAVQSVLERGAPVLWVMHRAAGRDGALRSFRSNFSPIFGPDGRAARVLVVSTDITAQRSQERFRESSLQMARLVSEETDLDTIAAQGLSIALVSGAHERGAVYIVGATGGLREAAVASGGAAQARPFAREEARRIAENAVASLRAAGSSEGGMIALPLLERNEAVGALVVEGADAEPRPEDVEVLSTLASQLAVGIRRSLFEARLKEYAAELESRVETRTAELQQKSEEMESFLYSVSHDLKAPLISIEGYAQSLLEDYGSALQGEGAMYLERIRKNATLMETLILDILELSRIGRIREQIEDVDMSALFADIAARLEDRFQQAGGRLDVPSALPRVHGERNRIEQLFNNLLENALKYRHPDRPPIVRIEGERVGEDAVFRVIDNGRGIPAGSIDLLFKIFQRLATPDGMSDPGGTGMGLAIVKRIVDTHGGRIWVGSVENEGTVFHVSLPGALDEAALAQGATTREQA